MKKYFLVSVFFLSLFNLFAQENSAIGDEAVQADSPAEEKAGFFSLIDKSLFFTLGPRLMLNTDDKTKSAPSPVMYSFGAGGDFLFKNGFSLETQCSFFTNYYLWDGENSQPAEVENRTATAVSFMIDLTAGYTLKLGQKKNHLISAYAGTGFLIRHAFLSNGVDSDDTNRITGSMASDDVSDINDSFFKNMNFFYPEIALSYSYVLSPLWKAGLETRVYLPAGSFSEGRGVDNMIFSFAVKISYK